MMYEIKRPSAESVREAVPQADRVMAWLAAREDVEQTLHAPLGDLPSERDERLARMADILQATALGLGPQAAAVWAGVPEPLLQRWLASDQHFASAVQTASALASAHGLEPGGAKTPAMIRVVMLALSKGATWDAAAAAAGLSVRKLRQLWRESPTLIALLDAARRARSRKPSTYVPSTYRPRKPGLKPSTNTYRLVQRDDQ
ncbi:hypothetical protein [Streptomyces longhuiensis]|uniref:hypothetical protein n=1 Tax=Streptomyces TaxID=1883 RepID=UPI001D0A15E7|nr:hypothetical protein [Streptomyces longhuiensis]UDL97142.1 hypothetical protein LGI35_02075 [Streptomyces longhuiensis]